MTSVPYRWPLHGTQTSVLSRWPGTHSDVRAPGNPLGDVLDGSGAVAKDGTPSAIEDAYADILAERAADPSTAPVRSVLRKGAVCLRDARLWHRGMPSR